MKYKDLEKDFWRRVKLSEREDGHIISTVLSDDNWYGKYETGFWHKGFNEIRILKGYCTLEDAEKGHIEFCEMSTEELENMETIG